jgi:2-polyprenyl-3-methyl-5-hydroxy-6-metoxy-1,4-benzoquinol methylase
VVNQHDDQSVEHNRRAHDAIGAGYDAGHPEIFNATEQARIASTIQRVVEMARRADGAAIHALDVGCGTGNLSSHLIAAGAQVTAADLSQKFIDIVARRFAGPALRGTTLLNGHDLRPIADGVFDLTATYSVLHHVPDYLSLVREMARVTRPGGLVMIDHERTEASWTSTDLSAFYREAVVWPTRRWWFWLDPSRYWKRLRPHLEWRSWVNPRWMPEGDLHIWPDDHIQWSRIEEVLADAGCEVIQRDQYLLLEPRYDRAVWERWRDKVSDMQLLVARRRA